ncbi:hypothetical protein, partial [Nocardia sp. NRRL WC-3656]|uniref:hypothetical protein n=1 Tax=Nocardia sp. NRRL WC-3656 TaxID=1463824 RepID=UPI001E4CB4A8
MTGSGETSESGLGVVPAPAPACDDRRHPTRPGADRDERPGRPDYFATVSSTALSSIASRLWRACG